MLELQSFSANWGAKTGMSSLLLGLVPGKHAKRRSKFVEDVEVCQGLLLSMQSRAKGPENICFWVSCVAFLTLLRPTATCDRAVYNFFEHTASGLAPTFLQLHLLTSGEAAQRVQTQALSKGTAKATVDTMKGILGPMDLGHGP